MKDLIVHTTTPYLLSPTHPVTVSLIGCGGTGSHMLSVLCRLHQGLVALGHPGLEVVVYDGDSVSPTNVGRQLFSASDIGLNKAVTLVSRVNRHAGLQWRAVPRYYTASLLKETEEYTSNIVITAVDRVSARRDVISIFNSRKPHYIDHRTPLYWMDFGNSKTSGQVVLGTIGKGVGLPTIFELHPNLEKHEEQDESPSCSMFEALSKQDLFINSSLAQLGGNLLWRLFTHGRISVHGFYMNLDTMRTNPIPVPNSSGRAAAA